MTTRPTSLFRVTWFYLTDCIYELVLESQLPHKIVNIMFTITNQNTELTVLWGSWLSKMNQKKHCVRERSTLLALKGLNSEPWTRTDWGALSPPDPGRVVQPHHPRSWRGMKPPKPYTPRPQTSLPKPQTLTNLKPEILKSWTLISYRNTHNL